MSRAASMTTRCATASPRARRSSCASRRRRTSRHCARCSSATRRRFARAIRSRRRHAWKRSSRSRRGTSARSAPRATSSTRRSRRSEDRLMNTTGSASSAFPRAMSTQHPDNVAVPFFASGPVMNGEDEVREAYYAFSHLGCDEQMWDFEGKEVDEFVVEKLLSSYETFFRERPLGDAVRLTPRVPNPALEKAQAKVLLEVLHSIPRHSDVARLFYERERAPIVEIIFPMTTSADELVRIREHYRARVAALDDRPETRAWFGEFRPREIDVIPLVEDRPYLLGVDAIVREYVRATRADAMRVFIARSDPALNFGMLPAILLSLVALARLARVSGELGVPIGPIIGVGGAPFRGGLRPDTVARVLARYPSVETFTI